MNLVCLSQVCCLSRQTGVLRMAELALADVFAEDSESERTFYGFSDSEVSAKVSVVT